MKPLFVFLLLFLSPAFSLHAQDFSVNFGLPSAKPGNAGRTKVIGCNSQIMYLAYFEQGGIFSRQKIIVSGYELSQLKRVFNKEIYLPEEKNMSYETENVLLIGEKITVFFSCVNLAKQVKQIKMQAYRLPGSNGETESDTLVTLCEVPFTKSRNPVELSFTLNRLQDAVLIIYRNPGEDGQILHYVYLRPILNVKKSGVIQLPDKAADASLIGCKIGNDYAYILFSNRFSGQRKRAAKDEELYFADCQLNSGTCRLKTIPLTGNVLIGADFLLSSTEDIFICGLVASVPNPVSQRALFFCKIRMQNTDSIPVQYLSFDGQFIAAYLRNQPAVDNQFAEYRLHYMEFNRDSTIQLIMEDYHVETICSPEMRMGAAYCNKHYYHDNILTLRLGLNGTLIWARTIPKQQYSVNDGAPFASYVPAYYGNKWYFIFNDHKRNLESGIKHLRTMDNPGKSVCRYVAISDNGEITGELLFHNEKMKAKLTPSVFGKPSPEALILYSEWKGGVKLIKLSLN